MTVEATHVLLVAGFAAAWMLVGGLLAAPRSPTPLPEEPRGDPPGAG